MADVISFARGAPSPDLLPVDAVREAASAALAKDATRALSYGTGIGHPELCAWIGERHGGVDPSRVMVTNGSLEAGWFVFNAFAGPGDEVVVEQPSYDRTLLMLDKIGADEIGVPLESDGIEVGGIERLPSARARSPSPTSSPTSTTRPAAPSRRRSGGGSSSSPPSTAS